MIPKTIHLIWLSNDEKPDFIKRCIRSWEAVMPDYQIKEWKCADFNFEELPAFVRQAYVVKKYAFAADYLRLYVVYRYGGIYMDADIFVKQRIDSFLKNRFFSFVEYHKGAFAAHRGLVDEQGFPKTEKHIPGLGIQAAFFGAEKGHSFLKKCMEFYEHRNFLLSDWKRYTDMITPDIFALCMREYGFRYLDHQQELSDGIVIYPSSYVAGCFHEIRKENYAIHCCAGSWRDYPLYKRCLNRIRQKINIICYLR